MAQTNPFADPHLADGLFGGLIPLPPHEYLAVPTLPDQHRLVGARQNNDLRDYHGETLFPPCGDQRQIGACAAWAIAYYMRAALASRWHIDQGTKPDLPDTLSPRFVYDLTRVKMGTYPQDSGSDMASAMSVLTDYGAAPERDCPYTGQADNGPIATEISSHVKQAAAFYGVSGVYRLSGTGDALLDQVEECLANFQPVVLAILVPQSFMRTGGNGRVPDPGVDETILGGHALCAGWNFYDNSFTGGRCVGGLNQWGAGWGENGGYYLPASYARTSHRRYGPYLSEVWTAV